MSERISKRKGSLFVAHTSEVPRRKVLISTKGKKETFNVHLDSQDALADSWIAAAIIASLLHQGKDVHIIVNNQDYADGEFNHLTGEGGDDQEDPMDDPLTY
jgi:hypothetical protein